MSYEFTKLSGVPAVAEFPEGANAIIETNGEIKRCPSSGGSSVPKPLTYDYMPEGYPSKSVQTTTLLEEQELAFALMGDAGQYAASLTEAFEIVEGQTYTVSWDGTEYECVCSVLDSMLAFGNLSIAGAGDDTGEPFTYGYNTKQATGVFGTTDTAASHTISVKRTGEIVTPMAEEFLPENLATKSDVAVVRNTANAAQTAANAAQTAANAAQTTANAAQTAANAAQTAADNAQTAAENAKIEPISYNYCASLLSKNGEFIGWYETMPQLSYNETLGSFYRSVFESTPLKYEDIPFPHFICDDYFRFGGPNKHYILFLTCLDISGRWRARGFAIDEQGGVFSVESAIVDKSTGEGLFLELSPQNYMLINSSTPGSTKKFKITVDDSGTLAATEVT